MNFTKKRKGRRKISKMFKKLSTVLNIISSYNYRECHFSHFIYSADSILGIWWNCYSSLPSYSDCPFIRTNAFDFMVDYQKSKKKQEQQTKTSPRITISRCKLFCLANHPTQWARKIKKNSWNEICRFLRNLILIFFFLFFD